MPKDSDAGRQQDVALGHVASDFNHPSRWAELAPLATLVAGLSYGFGWLTAISFFGRIGIAPEEAGVDFAWIAIRAFFLTVGVLTLLAVARLAVIYAAHLSERAFVVRSTRGVRALTFLGCLLASLLTGLVVSAISYLYYGELSIPTLLLITSGGIVAGIVVNLLRPPTEPITFNWNRRIWLRAFGFGLASCTLTFTAALPFLLGRIYYETVFRGSPLHVSIGLGLVIYDAADVRLEAASSDSPAGVIPTTCVLRLGSRDGTTIYYEPKGHTVLRINDQLAVASQPCS